MSICWQVQTVLQQQRWWQDTSGASPTGCTCHLTDFSHKALQSGQSGDGSEDFADGCWQAGGVGHLQADAHILHAWCLGSRSARSSHPTRNIAPHALCYHLRCRGSVNKASMRLRKSSFKVYFDRVYSGRLVEPHRGVVSMLLIPASPRKTCAPTQQLKLELTPWSSPGEA